MKAIKCSVVFIAILLITGMAWAGNTPEFDAVGYDDMNFFAQSTVYYQAVINGPNSYLEYDSSFYNERFNTNAGQLKESPCYGIPAALTDVWNQGTYEWWIVLQMKPEADINLNIYDCVLKHNESDIFRFADQTGRYRMPWGELMFNPAWNPLVSAEAYPGPFATSGFMTSMTLDARTMPGLVTVPLDEVSYTSKAHWPEGIVIAAPKTGNTNGSGQMEYNLKQGDVIHITVEIPSDTNTVDVWYGPDSVVLKYIGIINTEYFASGYAG
jgi:hypothetical protein